jgi:hypothetical protein
VCQCLEPVQQHCLLRTRQHIVAARQQAHDQRHKQLPLLVAAAAAKVLQKHWQILVGGSKGRLRKASRPAATAAVTRSLIVAAVAVCCQQGVGQAVWQVPCMDAMLLLEATHNTLAPQATRVVILWVRCCYIGVLQPQQVTCGLGSGAHRSPLRSRHR